MVYRLVATGTSEEKVVAPQRQKERELCTAVVDGERGGAGGVGVRAAGATGSARGRDCS